MNELVERVKEQGHWRILIHPTAFEKERIPTLLECEELVDKCQVRQRGWYFPHTDAARLRRGLDYIELETDFHLHPEAWRFYQSGQFIFWRALGEDNLENFPGGKPRDVQPGEWLGVLATLFELSEAYEFAARLAQEGALSDRFLLDIKLSGLEGRIMEFSTPDRSLGMECRCIEKELPRVREYLTAEFVPQARELALQHFLWITERFQCLGTARVFRRDQERFFEGRY